MVFAFGYYITSFLISLISPFWGLVGFICSLLLRFQDHYPQVATIKPFTLLLFGLILGCIINKDSLSTRSWRQDSLLITLLCISIIGLLLMSPSDLISETYVFICSLSLYYFASRILQKPIQFLILFLCMAASITYLGYEAIIAVTQNPENSPYIDPRSNRWQGIGYYENSNEFGQLMITTMPFLLAALLIKKGILIKLLSLSMMSVMIFVMIKCESRTVMITLALMFIGTFMLRGNGNILKKITTGGAMALIMLSALTFMPGPIQDRMNTVLDAGNDESFQGRTRSWSYGFDMLSWYPVTGVGKGQWMEYHGLMPHNSYVQIMAELGFFGILVFLLILYRCLKNFAPLFSTASPVQIKDNLFGVAKNSERITASPTTLFFVQQSDEAPPGDTADNVELDDLSKTIAIAVLITFTAWLLYIFLGNQGYSVWTYFYIGLCAAVANFLPEEKTDDSDSYFTDQNKRNVECIYS